MKYFNLMFLLVLFACTNSNNKTDFENNTFVDPENENIETSSYEDGTYCARVTYYNPNTGTNSTYKLSVEVENEELVQINWDNGGWLDGSHFSAQELDSDGTCSFTSDKGYYYTVEIIGDDCGNSDASRFRNDIEDDNQSLTCPNCQNTKYSYEEQCGECKNKKEKTCPKCGQYDPFMMTFDEQCSDCKDKEEAEEYENE